MSAKSKRDQLMAQLKNSLGAPPVQAPPEEAESPGASGVETPVSVDEIPAPVEAPKPVAKAVPTPKSRRGRAEEKSAPKVDSEIPSSSSGKQTAFWLDDEDRSILHEMGMQLYSQGIKPSHNLVVRAALRMLPKDHRFFEQVKELIEKDRRKLRHK